jgi:hypothetical protein
MGTRSGIQVEISPGKTLAIHCHWDGYPSHVGRILLTNYNTQESAEELVRLGDLSSIKSTLDECERKEPYHGMPDDFHKPAEIPTGKIAPEKNDIAYQYQFKNGQWYVKGWYDHPLVTTRWKKLTKRIIDVQEY